MQDKKIQNFGFVVVTDLNLEIIQVSSNIDLFLNEDPQSFIAKSFSEKIQIQDVENMSEITSQLGKTAESFYVVLELDNSSYWLTAHRSSRYFVFEFERAFYSRKALGLKLATETVNRFRSSRDMPELFDQIVKSLLTVNEYERILLARFDEDWNARVLADARSEALEDLELGGNLLSNRLFDEYKRSLLRALPLRVIVDSKSKPVSLYPQKTETEIDMRGCSLMCASTNYNRFLKENSIRSSIILPLIVKGELWGLVAGFHRSKHRIPLRAKEASVTLLHVASSCIENLINMEEREVAARMEENLFLLSNIISTTSDELHNIIRVNKDYFSEFLDCSGFAMVTEEETVSFGVVPEPEQLVALAVWLSGQDPESVYTTRNLATSYKIASKFKTGIPGLMAITIGEEHPLSLMWFLAPDEIDSRYNSRSINPAEIRYLEKLKERLLKYSLATAVRNRKEIEADREFLASIVDSSKDAIFGFSAQGNVISWNNGAVELFQIEAEEAIGTHISEIFGSDQDLSSLLESEPSDTFEKTIVRKDGQTLELSIKAYPINISNEDAVFGAAMIRDVTVQKQAERELLLMSQQLVESNKQLEEYAWVAAHDLKEPVRTMGTYAKLVANEYRSQLDKEGKVMLESIYTSAQSAASRIDDILSFSSLGRNELVTSSVKLEEVIEKVEKDLSQAIKESNSTLNYSELPVVKGDFDMLALMFQNLISNSIKFRNEKDPVINITGKRHNDKVDIMVSDNGIGIDMKYSEKVFGMFKRLNPNYPGTGLGLSIVKRIVDLHGGSIRVDSELKRGTTFHINLLAD